MTGIDYSDSTPDVAFGDAQNPGYDGNGNRLRMTDGTGTSTYAYDSLGRVTSYTGGATQGPGSTVGYVWDAASNLRKITYPAQGGGGAQIDRSFDDAGRLTTITDWLATANQTSWAYDPDGNMVSQTNPNNTTVTYTPDAVGQTTGIAHKQGAVTQASFGYTRDGLGQLTSATSTGIGAGTQNYTYTWLNQLATVNSSTYTHDTADNLTQLGSYGTVSGFDAANRYTSWTSGATTINYTWSNAGNRTQISYPNGPAYTYTYDAENRMVSHPAAMYRYDGDGLRTRTAVWGATVDFTYDIAQGLPLIIKHGADNYIYGPDGQPYKKITGTTPTWIGHDQLGSTRILTDTTGAKAGEYTYNAHGKITYNTGSATTPLQYAGQFKDGDTGNYWMRARHYDPTTGTFLQRDPINPITRQAYGYVGGNPLNRVDPLGLFWEELGNGVADFAGGVLNGITLGHGEQVLESLGQGGRVDYNNNATRLGNIAGVALQVPILVPSTARFVPVMSVRAYYTVGGVTRLLPSAKVATSLAGLSRVGFSAYDHIDRAKVCRSAPNSEACQTLTKKAWLMSLSGPLGFIPGWPSGLATLGAYGYSCYTSPP